MKGYVNIRKQDAFCAIIGFEVEYERGKEVKDKGIELFYEKHYTNGSRWTKYWNRHKTPSGFVRSHSTMFGSWAETLHVVLSKEDTELLHWWCWTNKSKIDPIKALYHAGDDDTMLVDQDMASVINKYKDILENMK